MLYNVLLPLSSDTRRWFTGHNGPDTHIVPVKHANTHIHMITVQRSETTSRRSAPAPNRRTKSKTPSGAMWGVACSTQPCGKMRPHALGRVELKGPGKGCTSGFVLSASIASRTTVYKSRKVTRLWWSPSILRHLHERRPPARIN